MFYISINKKALAKIRKEARATDHEIIGVLIGKVYDNLLVVTDAVSGEQASGATRVKLDNVTLAKIVNRIMEGEIKGNILGWYHSHPGFGVFMSATDIGTQQMLQQFSRKVAALVIDPTEDHYEIFTLDNNNGVISIPDEMIYKFKDGEDGIPPPLKELHNFQAVMEVVPNKAEDKLRYYIEMTTVYWPEKKCLICGKELKFDQLSGKWFCPDSDVLRKSKTGQDQPDEKENGEKPKTESKFKCTHCNKDLKFSKKLDAWYCKKCRRVYKHKTKPPVDQKSLETEDAQKIKVENSKTGPDDKKDVIVEAVSEMEIQTGKNEIGEQKEKNAKVLKSDVKKLVKKDRTTSTHKFKKKKNGKK